MAPPSRWLHVLSSAIPVLSAPALRAGVLAVVSLIVSAVAGPSLQAQDGPGHHGEDATEIVLLGTTHFAGSATDRHGSGLGDILSAKRQGELDEVADRVAGWGADRFFVECSPDEQPALDSAYRAFRGGEYDLTEPPGRVGRGEIYQLGFRTAAAAGLGGVDCVDAEVIVPGTRARKVAEEHNPDLLEAYRRYAEDPLYSDSLLAHNSIRRILLVLNRDSLLWKNHKSYLHYYARMGSFEGAGAEVRRESELSGRTFAAPFEVAERHMKELREAIESVDAELVDSVGPGVDYVVLLDREAAAAESGPGTGADTVSAAELGSLIARTSTTWIGFPDHHIGADMVAQWYKRNLRIYANIADAVEEDDDRVVLLMGQAHIWTLRRFFRDAPDFEVVAVDEVL